MDGSLEKLSCSSWMWSSHQWLQCTLSELDQNIAAMSKLIHEQDGHSFADRLELMKKIKELESSYHLLVKSYDQLSARSSSVDRHFIDFNLKLESPDSNPNIFSSDTNMKDNSLAENPEMFVEMSMLVEDNQKHLRELAKRYEEKREANRKLWSKVEKLVEEKHELIEKHNKLMHENKTLCYQVKQLKCEDCKDMNKKHNSTSHLFKFKKLILGALSGAKL